MIKKSGKRLFGNRSKVCNKKTFTNFMIFFLISTFMVQLFPLKSLSAIESASSQNNSKPKKIELTDKRTETSKTYDNGDGTYKTEVHQEPIHYMENGK